VEQTAGKVLRFDLRKIRGRLEVGNPDGVLDIAADSREKALETLLEWLDPLCDREVVNDVTDYYCEVAADNACCEVEADIGIFDAKKTTAATVVGSRA